MTRYAALHVESAAAEHEFAGLDVVDDFLRHLHGQELLGQQVGPEGLFPERAVVVHANSVDVADHDDAALGIALRSLQIRDVAVAVLLLQIGEHIVLVRMSLEIRHSRVEVVDVLRDFRLSSVARVVDGGDVDHFCGKFLDFFKRIEIHTTLLTIWPARKADGPLSALLNCAIQRNRLLCLPRRSSGP